MRLCKSGAAHARVAAFPTRKKPGRFGPGFGGNRVAAAFI